MPLSNTEMTVAIASVTVATVVSRSGILVAGERLRFSRHVEAALRFAPACALAGLIVPEVLYPAGTLDVSLGNPRLPATIAAIAFLLWRQSVLGGIAVGMGAYAVARLL